MIVHQHSSTNHSGHFVPSLDAADEIVFLSANRVTTNGELNELADQARKRSDWAVSLKWIELSRKIAQECRAKDVFETALSILHFGALLQSKGDVEGALQRYREAHDFFGLDGSAEHQWNRGVAVYGLGHGEQAKGNLEEAFRQYHNAMGMLKGIQVSQVCPDAAYEIVGRRIAFVKHSLHKRKAGTWSADPPLVTSTTMGGEPILAMEVRPDDWLNGGRVLVSGRSCRVIKALNGATVFPPAPSAGKLYAICAEEGRLDGIEVFNTDYIMFVRQQPEPSTGYVVASVKNPWGLHAIVRKLCTSDDTLMLSSDDDNRPHPVLVYATSDPTVDILGQVTAVLRPQD